MLVNSPYNYGETMHELEFLESWADWACGLHQRKAVYYAVSVSDAQCDEIGSAAAMREPGCSHIHSFACAIPPTTP